MVSERPFMLEKCAFKMYCCAMLWYKASVRGGRRQIQKDSEAHIFFSVACYFLKNNINTIALSNKSLNFLKVDLLYSNCNQKTVFSFKNILLIKGKQKTGLWEPFADVSWFIQDFKLAGGMQKRLNHIFKHWLCWISLTVFILHDLT